jgi:tight adherence protein B
VRRRRLAAAALAALLLPATASASVVIRSFDSSAYPRLGVTVVTSTPSDTPPALTESGQPVAALHAQNLGREKSIVLAIDRSHSMKGQALADAVAAARAFLAAKQRSDRVAIVAFGSRASRLTDFSTSAADALAVLNGLRVDGRQGTALYDAVQLASQALGGEENHGRVIVLVTDGRDVSSYSTLENAIDSARKSGVTVYPIGIVGSQFTPDALQTIAGGTGGLYRAAASSEDLAGIYTSIADELRRTWRLDYLTAARPGDSLDLRVSLGGLGSTVRHVSLPTGVRDPGGTGVLPDYAFTRKGTAVLGLIVGLLVLIGVGLTLATFREGWLRGMLAPHLGLRKVRAKRKTKRDRLAAFGAIFRATERMFSETRPWQRLSKLIERADLPIRTVELVYASLGSGVALALLFSMFGASGLVSVFGLLLGAALPPGYVAYKANRRRAAFENQLPDVLVSIAASLKAGHSFKSALQSIVDEGVEPTSKELKRVLTESRLGRPMDDALAEMASRVGSKNFEFIVTAVNIQTQVGGSLAGLFDMVADTVRQRHQFARKIRSLTAMGRMSAYVLVGLPIFVAFCLTMLNRNYMAPLWHTSTGNTLIGVACVMIVFGATILRKIVSFRG